MSHSAPLQERINGSYADLSEKLQVAAEYVTAHPVDIVSRSLRSVAATSGVSPATFSRLARALGYADYEAMRDGGRALVEKRMAPFSERATKLRDRAANQPGKAFLANQVAACAANIEALVSEIDEARLEAAVTRLNEAENVLLVGAMGSAGLVDYFGYMAQWFKSTWRVAGRNGVELSAALSRLGENDVLFALSKTPYARRTVAALEAAKDKGASTIAITDSPLSPALGFADFGFVVPTESPQFFSSYAATLVLMEAFISMSLARSGPEAEGMIRAAEDQIERLGENWAR
ncbi:MAG: MurR/RpiR family transcriptional regulator [Silicimonas sp.]|nr:MurR/RpiR family transcriptional regulator [Silicimonas sp.]